MDEHAEERREAEERDREERDDRRESQAEADYWTMQDQGLEWAEFVSMEQWRG